MKVCWFICLKVWMLINRNTTTELICLKNVDNTQSCFYPRKIYTIVAGFILLKLFYYYFVCNVLRRCNVIAINIFHQIKLTFL